MRYFAQKAKHATFVCQDFRVVMSTAQAGDVIYCDPPYVPLSDTANFTDYAAGGFGPDDQRDLALLAMKLGERNPCPHLQPRHGFYGRRLRGGGRGAA